MARSIKTLKDVVDWNLCIGCGACHYMCRHDGIRLVNVPERGIVPEFTNQKCAECTECLPVCPGYEVDGDLLTRGTPAAESPAGEFGVALEIWEGYAADPEIRHQASSGGLLTALALYCLEREEMQSVVHTGMDASAPWLNRTVQSRDRADLLAVTGSRYSPSSPCEGLAAVEQSDRPCVFIGKPCDASAAMKAARERPELEAKLGLVLTFFCAGTPTTASTLNLLAEMGIRPEQIERLRYRGEGWPGGFKVETQDASEPHFMPYQESWGRLARKRPMRCQLCPDGLGRVADLACGDAWEKFMGNGDEGRSIVLVRTERGRRILHGAIEAGYVRLERVGVAEVLQAQQNLLGRRRELHGRLLGMRMLGIPVPRYPGFQLPRAWWAIPLSRKLRSLLGTVRRCLTRGLWRRTPGPASDASSPAGTAGSR